MENNGKPRAQITIIHNSRPLHDSTKSLSSALKEAPQSFTQRVHSQRTLKLHGRDTPSVLSFPMQSEQAQLTPCDCTSPCVRISWNPLGLFKTAEGIEPELLCFHLNLCYCLECFCRERHVLQKICPQDQPFQEILSF